MKQCVVRYNMIGAGLSLTETVCKSAVLFSYSNILKSFYLRYKPGTGLVNIRREVKKNLTRISPNIFTVKQTFFPFFLTDIYDTYAVGVCEYFVFHSLGISQHRRA